jgi:Protein of unknown function (DUF3574)
MKSLMEPDYLCVPALYADDEESSRCKVGDLFLRTELFFGPSKPEGEVTEEEFQPFLAQHVTPRFPDGLTVVTGLGLFGENEKFWVVALS